MGGSKTRKYAVIGCTVLMNWIIRNRRLSYIVIFSFALLAVAITIDISSESADINNLSIFSQEEGIIISWSNRFSAKWDGFKLRIEREDKDGECYFYNLSDYENSLLFDKAVVGGCYRFEFLSAGYDAPIITLHHIHLKEEDYPRMDWIKIETENGQLPQENTDGERPYKAASFTYYNADHIPTFSLSGFIKIRGNSTAVGTDKKPYRIKFTQDVSIFSDNHKEYVLLRSGNNLNQIIGSRVAFCCGVAGEPEYRYVNLEINGDYRGCYILTESIEDTFDSISLGLGGFVVEQAPENRQNVKGERTFRTNNQDEFMAWSLYYPKDMISESRQGSINEYLQEIEDAICNNSDDIWQYIDITSFVCWVMAHDILGTSDFYGSNMYVYRERFDEEDTKSGQLKIGPLWDFDSIYDMRNEWSGIHTGDVLHYDLLFERDDFREEYARIWNNVYSYVEEDVLAYMYIEVANNGDLIGSWELDQKRWAYEEGESWNLRYYPPDMGTAWLQISDWMTNRTEWINEHVQEGDFK